MKTIKKIIVPLFLLFTIMYSCNDIDYLKDFTDGEEIRYVGKTNELEYFAGKNRILLKYKLSADPNIRKSVIYWNLKKDSLEIDINRDMLENGTDVEQFIPNLQEGIYSFEIYNRDQFGNVSVPEYITAKAYGDRFQHSIYDREVNKQVGTKDGFFMNDKDEVFLVFLDSLTTSKDLIIEYNNINGQKEKVTLANNRDTILLPNVNEMAELTLTTRHVPEYTAIDIFEREPIFIRVPSYEDMLILAVPKPYKSAYVEGFDLRTNNSWDVMWDKKWPTGWPEKDNWYEEVNWANFYTEPTDDDKLDSSWFTIDVNGYIKPETFTYYYYWPPGQHTAPRVLELWSFDSDKVPTAADGWNNWVKIAEVDMTNANDERKSYVYKNGLKLEIEKTDATPRARYYRVLCRKNYKYDDSIPLEEQSPYAFGISVSEISFTSYGKLTPTR